MFFLWFALEETDSVKQLKSKTGPSVAPKPRPWSMVNSEGGKSSELLLSDGSSPVTSTGNTPDSVDALDSSESSSIDRRIAKDLKAKKTGKETTLYFHFPTNKQKNPKLNVARSSYLFIY